MPKLSEMLRRPEHLEEDGPSVPLSDLRHRIDLSGEQFIPPANVNLRCPFPAIGIVSPDSLRQFYSNPAPKFRVLTSGK